MTVGALSALDEARISPIASGCPSQSITSQLPPAARMKWQTHPAASLTSPACAGSAPMDGMRRNPASSSNQSTGGNLAAVASQVRELPFQAVGELGATPGRHEPRRRDPDRVDQERSLEELGVVLAVGRQRDRAGRVVAVDALAVNQRRQVVFAGPSVRGLEVMPDRAADSRHAVVEMSVTVQRLPGGELARGQLEQQ